MSRPTIARLLEFQELLCNFSEVERLVHVKRGDKHILESDTEHSYNLAMTAWFVAGYFPEVNKDKVIQLCLVHDLVEIHAGDTFSFAEQKVLDGKAEREAAAQKRLAKDWADFPDMHAAIKEYEDLKTPEACFAYALDKLMPMFVVYLNEGHTWKEKRLTLQRINEEKLKKTKVSPEIAKYWQELYSLLLKSPHLFPKV